VDVNNYKIQTWLEDRYAELAGKEDYKKLRERYRDKGAGAAARILDNPLIERLGRQFRTRDTGPVSAFHAELLEQLTQRTKIDDDALVKLAQARGQAVREALLERGLEESRLGVATPGTQATKDKLVPSRMSLGAARAVATEPAPAAPSP
jgi:hypothetical protein